MRDRGLGTRANSDRRNSPADDLALAAIDIMLADFEIPDEITEGPK